MGQNAGPENPRHATINPSDVAHHLRVAADKYHEHARVLLEDLNEAIQALPDERKPAYRHTREALAKLFDDHAGDAIRLAHLFDDIDQSELIAALGSIASANARKCAEIGSGDGKLERIRSRLVAGKVDRPAIPGGRDTPASDHELSTAIATAGAAPVCGCAFCAEENFGSPQHTPMTFVGNELVNRPVGGVA